MQPYTRQVGGSGVDTCRGDANCLGAAAGKRRLGTAQFVSGVGGREESGCLCSGKWKDDSVSHISFPPESGINGRADLMLKVLWLPVF
jgi:hypothetical protein